MAGKSSRRRGSGGGKHKQSGGGAYRMYGRHACLAALANPRRDCLQLTVQTNARDEYAELLRDIPDMPHIEYAAKETLDKLAGDAGAPHQGIVLYVKPLQPAEPAYPDDTPCTVAILDQVTDPRNVGAVLRSAAAFGLSAVIVQDRHCPPESGALAKAASGCLELVPLVRVTNIANHIIKLQEQGFSVAALDVRAQTEISAAPFAQKQAFLLGSEGKGARRLPMEKCDTLLRLPMEDTVESLNIAVTAGIVFHSRYAGLR